MIYTQSRAYDGHGSRGRHEDRGRPLGSGHLDRSRSDQRPAPRENERRDREEASRGTYRGNGRAIHSDRNSGRERGSPPRDGASSVSGRPRPEASSRGTPRSRFPAKDIRHDRDRH